MKNKTPISIGSCQDQPLTDTLFFFCSLAGLSERPAET